MTYFSEKGRLKMKTKCPVCGKKFDPSSGSCPYCGYILPVDKRVTPQAVRDPWDRRREKDPWEIKQKTNFRINETAEKRARAESAEQTGRSEESNTSNTSNASNASYASNASRASNASNGENTGTGVAGNKKAGPGLLIAAWVLDFLLAPVGIILSIIGIIRYKNKSYRTGCILSLVVAMLILLVFRNYLNPNTDAEEFSAGEAESSSGDAAVVFENVDSYAIGDTVGYPDEDLTLLYAEWIDEPECDNPEELPVPGDGERYIALFFRGTEHEDTYYNVYGYEILADGKEYAIPDNTYGMTVDGFDASSSAYFLNNGMSIVKALIFIVPGDAEKYSFVRKYEPTARIDFTKEDIGTEPFAYSSEQDAMGITEETAVGDEFTDDNGLVWKFAGTQIIDPEYDEKDKNAVLFKFDVTNNSLMSKDFDFFTIRDSLYIDGLLMPEEDYSSDETEDGYHSGFDVTKLKGHETQKLYVGFMLEPYVSESGNMNLILYSGYDAEKPFAEISKLAE